MGKSIHDEEHILAAIRRHVWAANFDADEIGIIVSEDFLMEPAQNDWLRARIDAELQIKLADEATWPTVTDCDRLDEVFNALNAQGVMVEQDAGMTKSDALGIVTDAFEFAQEIDEAEGIEGYCYYHGQDLEYALSTGDLWLGFGHFSGKEDLALEIGQRVKCTLEAAGFIVEWDGGTAARMVVKGIRWQRRGP